MEICLLSYTHEIGDSRIHYRQGASLSQAGHTVTVVTRSLPGAPEHRELDGIRYRTVPKPRRLFRGWGVMVNLLAYPRMFRQAWLAQAQVYVCYELQTLFMGLILKRLRGTRLVYDCHEYYPESLSEHLPPRWRRWAARNLLKIERAMAARADALVMVNEHLASRVAGSSPRVSVVPNYPHKSLLEAVERHVDAGKYTGRRVVLYLGAITEERGIDTCLRALADVRAAVPNVLLLLVGPVARGFEARMYALIASLGLQSHVQVIREVPYTEVAAYLAAAEIGLILQKTGNGRYDLDEPIKYFEYCASSLPIVGSSTTAMRRLAAKTGSAILVDENKPAEAAAAIVHLLQNDAERARMAARAREAAVQWYNWEVVEPRWLEACTGAALPVASDPVGAGEMRLQERA